MRLLFWLGLALLVILALKKKIQPPAASSGHAEPDAPQGPQGPQQGTAESMVCCAHCQIYLPASEAVRRGEQVYCSKEHAELA
ncbi:PP0621 family protein [Undibacterium sp. Di27W]|uniref:PP0621 family protein n=1 Tax=Undibacterium sp. Di27W TaxID=3413036 RepID=UPI003BF2207B